MDIDIDLNNLDDAPPFTPAAQNPWSTQLTLQTPPPSVQPKKGNDKRRSSIDGADEALEIFEQIDDDKRRRIDPEEALENSKAHFQTKYVLLKALSCGDNGEVHAAIHKADLLDVQPRHGNDTTGENFYNAIRERLVAVKFTLPGNLEGNLTNEIVFLTWLFPSPHPRISYHLDSCMEGSTQWLVLPYASAGSLLDFMQKHIADFNLSLRWHLISQTMQALLFLFFGIADFNNAPAEAPQFGPFKHGDIFAGNTLVSAPDSSDPQGFPNFAISDFGRACEMMPQPLENPTVTLILFRQQQCKDFTLLAELLRDVTLGYYESLHPCAHGQYVTNEDASDDQYDDEDGECTRCAAVEELQTDEEGPEARFLETCRMLMNFTSVKQDLADGYKFVLSVIKTADEEKMAHYEPLSEEVAASLQKPFVTNDDLRRVLGIF